MRKVDAFLGARDIYRCVFGHFLSLNRNDLPFCTQNGQDGRWDGEHGEDGRWDSEVGTTPAGIGATCGWHLSDSGRPGPLKAPTRPFRPSTCRHRPRADGHGAFWHTYPTALRAISAPRPTCC